MAKPKDGIKILSDSRHWWGWLLSSSVITTALVFVMILIKKPIHIPFWVVLVAFIVIFIFEVIVDVIKHLVELQ